VSFTYDRLAPCFRFVYTFACIALFLCCCRFSVNKDLYMRIVSLMDQRRGTNRPQASRTALAVITFSNYNLDVGAIQLSSPSKARASATVSIQLYRRLLVMTETVREPRHGHAALYVSWVTEAPGCYTLRTPGARFTKCLTIYHTIIVSLS